MTCTNKQVGILMDKIKKHNQIIAAAKAGMNQLLPSKAGSLRHACKAD